MKGSATEWNKTALGIEFGSTRIKAILVDADANIIAQVIHDWENELKDGVWTYSEEAILLGLQDAYAHLKKNVKEQYGQTLTTIGCIGISAMMHGYIALNKAGKMLVPFRTWRNTMTRQAATELTEKFRYNIPQRWTIAHLYQAILNQEQHLPELHHLTTLAGYVHWRLTGNRVLGMGEASGIFPILKEACTYDTARVQIFDELAKTHQFSKPLLELIPPMLPAGEMAGHLSESGAKLLDPAGDLQPGVVFCPPEGDAETGMVATNCIAPRTGNVSAGTSMFASVVLEKPLENLHEEICNVVTPSGDAVAMVHCSNCTSDINAWEALVEEIGALYGAKADRSEVFTKLFQKSVEGEDDCGGIVPINYHSGEAVTHFDAGMPLLLRKPDSHFSLANLMRAHIYSCMATLAIGFRILRDEGVAIDRLTGHGGLFKTKGVAQKYLASALHAPIDVMASAGEGGAWGMALLAAYTVARANGYTKSIAEYLQEYVFNKIESSQEKPDVKIQVGFSTFLNLYEKALIVQRTAVEVL